MEINVIFWIPSNIFSFENCGPFFIGSALVLGSCTAKSDSTDELISFETLASIDTIIFYLFLGKVSFLIKNLELHTIVTFFSVTYLC